MPYLIDTNIAIHVLDGTESVLDALAAHDGEVLLSSLSLAELQRSVFKEPKFTALRQARLEVLLRGIPVLPFDAAAALAYGRIIVQCGWARGRDFDRMIAAHAITVGAVLVTDNEADFRDVPALRAVNWKTGK